MLKILSYRPIVNMLNTSVEIMDERNEFMQQLFSNEDVTIFGESEDKLSFYMFITCKDGCSIWHVRNVLIDTSGGSIIKIKNIKIVKEIYYSDLENEGYAII